MSVQVSYKKQLTFGILFVIVLAIAVEGVAQIIWFFHLQDSCGLDSNPYFENHDRSVIEQMCNDYELFEYDHSGTIRQNKPNQHFDTINTNSLGFRGSEDNPNKTNDSYMIIVVGGSTTFGLGATSDETTIPAYLQSIFLEHDHDNVEVINAGVVGVSSADEVFYIKSFLISLNPDLFVIFDGYNDSFNVRIKDHSPEDKYFSQFENMSEIEKFIRAYFKMFATPNVIFQFTHDYRQYLYLTDEVKQRNTEAWINRWDEICDIGRSTGFDTLVTVQPMVGSSDRIMTPYETKNHEYFKGQKQLELLNALGDSLNQLNCYTADLRHTFDGVNEHVFLSNVHTSNFGNKIIAEKMFEQILPIFLSRQ